MTTTVATDYDNIEIQQQYSDVNNRWDVDDWDNENSSARLFERSRIKALAGAVQPALFTFSHYSQTVLRSSATKKRRLLTAPPVSL
ncbi:hypothetical protein CB1_000157009 [Camelus ferus]|nr:hypothetical protein CB1_000157009 [Camelus ferus]